MNALYSHSKSDLLDLVTRPPHETCSLSSCASDYIAYPHSGSESAQVDWLIIHFNRWFAHHHVVLVHSEADPEYFPATAHQPARIAFAHGFFSSALHEVSHWCIAGAQRRTLPDLGYWYAPDGRTYEQQILFEQVEIKPQALEWLFTQACLRRFRVSLDNLNGEAGNGVSFKQAVFDQVQCYLDQPDTIPQDARRFIDHLCCSIRAGQPLQYSEFKRSQLD